MGMAYYPSVEKYPQIKSLSQDTMVVLGIEKTDVIVVMKEIQETRLLERPQKQTFSNEKKLRKFLRKIKKKKEI